MTTPSPAAALSGVQTGRYCDACNKRVRTGDLVRGYATYYDHGGWRLRRLWCTRCGDSSIETGTSGADEVVVEAIFWNHRLISIEIADRSRPADGGQR